MADKKLLKEEGIGVGRNIQSMLKKEHRLLKGARLKNEKFFETPFLKLKTAKNNLLHNRYGFIVSTKVDKRAIVRNRVKRRIRSCFESLNLRLSQGYDMLLIIKKPAIKEKTASLCLTLENFFLKEGVLK